MPHTPVCMNQTPVLDLSHFAAPNALAPYHALRPRLIEASADEVHLRLDDALGEEAKVTIRTAPAVAGQHVTSVRLHGVAGTTVIGVLLPMEPVEAERVPHMLAKSVIDFAERLTALNRRRNALVEITTPFTQRYKVHLVPGKATAVLEAPLGHIEFSQPRIDVNSVEFTLRFDHEDETYSVYASIDGTLRTSASNLVCDVQDPRLTRWIGSRFERTTGIALAAALTKSEVVA